MSYFGSEKIADPNRPQDLALVTSYNALKADGSVRLIGAYFYGSTIDSNFWTAATAGTGTATQSGGVLALETGVTSNSSATLQSARIARYVQGQINIWLGRFVLPDGGATNNSRRWGAFNSTDGVGFNLIGTTFGVFSRRGSSDTVVANGSFNGLLGATYALDNNVHKYEIRMTFGNLLFYIDGVLLHTLTPTTVPLIGNFDLPCRAENINTGGGASDVVLNCWGMTITRIGETPTRTKYANITTATTTTLKLGPGALHAIVVNNKGSSNATANVYDSTTGSGATIGALDLVNSLGTVSYQMGLDFQTGLTIVTTGAGINITVLYE